MTFFVGRQITFLPLRIIWCYQVADDRVEVMRVMHGARDLVNIWSQLEDDL